MEKEIKLFENQDMKVRAIYNDDGSISVNVEDVARGFGFVQIKKQ